MHICTITPISKTVGAKRIVGAVAIPYPVGNPELPKDKEDEVRLDLLNQAAKLLQTTYQ